MEQVRRRYSLIAYPRPHIPFECRRARMEAWPERRAGRLGKRSEDVTFHAILIGGPRLPMMTGKQEIKK